MEGIINFHHDLFYFLVVIGFFVIYMLGRCIYLFDKDKHTNNYIVLTHAPMLEII
jgi:hypothetical protein